MDDVRWEVENVEETGDGRGKMDNGKIKRINITTHHIHFPVLLK